MDSDLICQHFSFLFPGCTCNVFCVFLRVTGATSSGVITGLNKTVLSHLPPSLLLIKVESMMMGAAFLSMIIVRLPVAHIASLSHPELTALNGKCDPPVGHKLSLH